MLKIKPDKLKSEPPGGWMWIEPKTGRAVRAGSFQSLVNQAIAYLVANKRGDEIGPDFGFKIEADVAERLPAGWAYDSATKNRNYVPAPAKASIGLGIVESKTSRVKNLWERGGRKRVDAAVASERAKQCVGCELNKNVGCLTCNGVYQNMQAFMGKLGTPYDKRVQACGGDQVFIKIKVWMTEATLRAAIPSFARPKLDGYPAECWHRKILEGDQRGSSMGERMVVTDQSVAGSTPAPAVQISATAPSGADTAACAPQAENVAQGSAQENTTARGVTPPVQVTTTEPSPQAADAPAPKRKRTRKPKKSQA